MLLISTTKSVLFEIHLLYHVQRTCIKSYMSGQGMAQ